MYKTYAQQTRRIITKNTHTKKKEGKEEKKLKLHRRTPLRHVRLGPHTRRRPMTRLRLRVPTPRPFLRRRRLPDIKLVQLLHRLPTSSRALYVMSPVHDLEASASTMSWLGIGGGG